MQLQWIDPNTISTWQFPINFPQRDYQYNIIQECLFRNTLVSIPTGLGKTFISAVVMMNFLRWFPFGKVCFLAPTRPLVAQQMSACKSIGISESLMVELTGSCAPLQRQALWKGKRVFFLTPQIMQNDIYKGICPCEFITCLVIDESHRARGKHSYCVVVQELRAKNPNFRIVALTATPASTSSAVQDVVDALLIEHVEIRTEESLDIRPYIHKKSIQSFVVELGDEILRIKNLFERCILNHFISRLQQARAIWESNPEKISKSMIIRLREAFRARNQSTEIRNSSLIEADFGALISFMHSYELLLNHGIASFYSNIYWILNDKSSKFKGFLARDPQMLQMINALHGQFSNLSAENILLSHPKMGLLQEHLIEFFDASGSASKVIVFAEFRETVNQIVCLLSSVQNRHQQNFTMKVACFMGKADGKSGKGIRQKEQLEIIERFRSGEINVLVSTSIGEEGLDIGEVDLIICYDSQSSPIRTLQRMGRTGRKRNGNIILLLTRGKEEAKWKQTNANYKAIQNAVSNKNLKLFPHGTRMIPKDVIPRCEKIIVSGLSMDDFSFDVADEEDSQRDEDEQSLSTPLFELGSEEGKREEIQVEKERKEEIQIEKERKKEIQVEKLHDSFLADQDASLPHEEEFYDFDGFDDFELVEQQLIEDESKQIPISKSSEEKVEISSCFLQEPIPNQNLAIESCKIPKNPRPSIETVVHDLFGDIFPGESDDNFTQSFDPSILSCLDDAFVFYNQEKGMENNKKDDDDQIQEQKSVEESCFDRQKLVQESSFDRQNSPQSIHNQKCDKNDTCAINITPPDIPENFFEDDNWEMDLIEAQTSNKIINHQSPIPMKRSFATRNLIISSPITSATASTTNESPLISSSKRTALIRNFLDVEAEEEEEENDSQEQDSQDFDAEEMQSFIAEDASSPADMDFYRKSLLMSQMVEFQGRKSLFERQGRFKLKL